MFKTFAAGASALLLSLFGMVLVASPASADPPADCPNYTVSAETTTSLSASPSSPGVGDSFDAEATVDIDGLPATGGTVEFSYAGQTETATVVAGQASATFTAIRGTNTLSAIYTGQCLAQQIAIGTSEDSLTIIAGVQVVGGGGDDDDNAGGGANRPGAVAGGGTTAGGGTVGGLGATGLGSGTQLLGLAGAGLLAAGAITFLARRRLG